MIQNLIVQPSSPLCNPKPEPVADFSLYPFMGQWYQVTRSQQWKHSKTDLVGDVQPSYDPQCLQYSHVNFWLKSRPIWISVINSDNLKYLIIIIYYLLNKFSVIIKLCFIFIEREMKHNCIDKNALSRVQNIRITKKWISDNEYYLSHYHKFGVLDTKCWQT